MMGVGILAAAGVISGDTPPWLPEDALDHLDFVEGNYYSDGAERSVGDILGGGFDAGYIVPGSGMQVPEDQETNRPDAIGVLFTSLAAGLAAGMTLVFEFSQTTNAHRGLIFFDDLTGSPDWTLRVERISASGNGFFVWDFDDLDFREPMAELLDNGTNRLAVTLGRNLGGGSWRYAVSGNGSAVQTADVTYSADAGFVTNGLAVIRIGGRLGYGWPNGYLRSITRYAARPDADLPGLST